MASPIPGVPYLALYTEQGVLSAIDFLYDDAAVSRAVGSALATATADVTGLLASYFVDSHTPVPLLQPPHATPFQQRVWQALQQIPPGETRRYGELAKQLGSSARAVAGACRANPIPILIPCHRVVSATGLGGYMGEMEGSALEIKRWLLHHEGYV